MGDHPNPHRRPILGFIHQDGIKARRIGQLPMFQLFQHLER